MEKFRKFGDASTGINPFTFVFAPPTLGLIGAYVMFPMRLLFSSVFVLLLLVTDTLAALLSVLFLGVLGRALLGPLQRLWLRGLLFFIGHVLVQRYVPLVKPVNATTASTENGTTPSSSAASFSSHPRGGDVVVCNMQSVWDVAVLEVALAVPAYAVVVPAPTASGVVVFWPSPLQRFQVWRHVYQTASQSYLEAWRKKSDSPSTDTAGASGAAVVDLVTVQEKAVKHGVPLLYFAEATCSNGKGVLLMPGMTCSTGSTTESGAAGGCALRTAAITYDTPAVQTIVADGVWTTLFRAGELLYGSTSPAWSSPFFPTALVAVQTATVAGARPAASPTPARAKAPRTVWSIPATEMQPIRQSLCVRVDPGMARRQPLGVGLKEKAMFVDTYAAMRRGE